MALFNLLFGTEHGHGLQLWDAWDLWEDFIYFSDEFNDYMSAKEDFEQDEIAFLFGGTSREELLSFIWMVLYPYSSHDSPPEGFPLDFIEEKLDELEEEWKLEQALEEEMSLLEQMEDRFNW